MPSPGVGVTTLPRPAHTAIPIFSGYVVDLAHVIPARDGQLLTDRLGDFQRRTGHQLALVTIPDLHGEDVAAFTLRLARQWGVGRKGVDDGIVLLVAPNDHTARIEVGTGLEHVLTNAFCAEVMDR